MNKEVKNNGVIFTPKEIVDTMCLITRLNTEIVLTKKIMEPSFGEGAFLLPIIETIIIEGKKQNLNNNEIINIIKGNVLGIEKNREYYNVTILKIQQLLNKYGLPIVYEFPNLICGDTLATNQFDEMCDYVIGNPPYVNIHNATERKILKSFAFTQEGMADLYIAFFEKGIQMLNSTGRLCYITPNSYFTSVAGRKMREYFIKTGMLQSIINYEHKQIFSDATTYSCITILNKEIPTKFMSYETQDFASILSYEDFYINNKFYFAETENAQEQFKQIIKYESKQNKFTVKNGYATLCDKIFIDSEIAKNSKYSISVIKSSTGKTHKAFFPYNKDLSIVSFDEIEKKEISTATFLNKNAEILLKRNIDKHTKWYCYGRTQALTDTYKNKYAISNLYKTIDDIKITHCPCGTGVYGGIYILTEVEKEIIENTLKTDDFLQYVRIIGKYKNGGYYTVSSKDIEKYLNYKFEVIS